MKADDKTGLDQFSAKAEVLYHGSGVPGIRNFKPAQHQTMGTGLYCTTERDSAEVYASWRARTKYGGELDPVDGISVPKEFTPTLYSFRSNGMRFYDLRREDAKKALHPLWIKHLKENRQEMHWTQKYPINEVIRRAGEDRPLNRNSFTGGYQSSINQLFTEFLKQLGFDGVVGVEFDRDGKFNTGECNSYVVFDPAKLEPISEDVLQTERVQAAGAEAAS